MVEEQDRKEFYSSDIDLLKDKFFLVDDYYVNSGFGYGFFDKKSGESQVLFEMEVLCKFFDILNEDLFQKIFVFIQ